MKAVKRSLAMLLALMLCVGMLSLNAFAADGHKHNYTGAGDDGHWCLIPGCPEYGEKKEHRFEPDNWHSGKYDSTHTMKCADCGALRNEGHTYAGATCTSPGKCACSAPDPTGTLNPNNHVNTEVRGTEAATCAEAGYTGDTYCKDCGKKIADGSIVPANGHNFSGAYVQGALGTGGEGHAQCCVKCGTSGTVVPHVWMETDRVPATCENEGSVSYKCVCGKTKTGILVKLECEDKDGDGNCDHCGGSMTCEHSEYDTLGTVEAGCENFGTEQRKCKKCGHVWNEILALKLGHDFQDTDDTHDTATCEAGGSKTQHCSRCGATQEVATDRLSHQYGDLIAEVHATCAADGVKAHYMCQLCKKNYVGTEAVTDEELKIEKLPHTPGTAVRENVVAATETTGGSYDLVTRCTVCNEVITSVHHTTAPTGTGTTVIPDLDVPLGGDPDDGVVIDEPEVPLAGLATRAEFVDYLYRQSGSPEAGLPTFTDVPADHEYAPAIGWAEENGITLGVGGGCFDPDGLVTVEQANLFLERYAKLYGMEMPELAALAGKEDDDIVDNASEVMDEFFGADA